MILIGKLQSVEPYSDVLQLQVISMGIMHLFANSMSAATSGKPAERKEVKIHARIIWHTGGQGGGETAME